MEQDFGAERFDLVYSIGVLAEHVPLRPALVASVARWLRPGGRFAFSTVHPDSASVPRTLARRLGSSVTALLPAPAKRAVRERLLAGGLYADEARVRELLTGSFAIESLERMESEAHLHCLCVGRKVSA
jgi:2-polyprenyl-3-methyl-5-hydroxy-6-metoxy-1,4-benzoquinol methylase